MDLRNGKHLAPYHPPPPRRVSASARRVPPTDTARAHQGASVTPPIPVPESATTPASVKNPESTTTAQEAPCPPAAMTPGHDAIVDSRFVTPPPWIPTEPPRPSPATPRIPMKGRLNYPDMTIRRVGSKKMLKVDHAPGIEKLKRRSNESLRENLEAGVSPEVKTPSTPRPHHRGVPPYLGSPFRSPQRSSRPPVSSSSESQ